MGGGPRYPGSEIESRSQEAPFEEEAHWETARSSLDAKLAKLALSEKFSLPPISPFIPTIPETPASQSIGATFNEVPEQRTIRLLIDHGIDPKSLTASQLQAFHMQCLTVQLDSIRAHQHIQARTAVQEPQMRSTPSHRQSYPEAETTPLEIPGLHTALSNELAARQVLMDNGIDPYSLLPSQFQTFSAQTRDIQHKMILLYAQNLSKLASQEPTRPMTPIPRCPSPCAESRHEQLECTFHQQPSNQHQPFQDGLRDREAEAAHSAALQEYLHKDYALMNEQMSQFTLAAYNNRMTPSGPTTRDPARPTIDGNVPPWQAYIASRPTRQNQG